MSATTSSSIVSSRRMGTFIHALLFMLGFAAVFVVVWGGAATLLGRALYEG